MLDVKRVGRDFLVSQSENILSEIKHITPSEYNEKFRYLPESVTPLPGYIRYDVNPFMREIVDCFDVNSPVREVNLKKGVQITYSTVLESGAFYYMGHVKTLPMMYMTADKELATARIENNFLPMLAHSGMRDIIQTSDDGNSRKTGKTKDQLQWKGGGYLMTFGARNADKMRSFSVCIMMKDEIDTWPTTVGRDGDPDSLSDDRCSAYWSRRKIFRGSTPLIKGDSKIDKAYLRGDQRKYFVRCKICEYPQFLRWETVNKETGLIGGFQWETDDGALVFDSVCYCCQKCGGKHYEHDKELMFSENGGAVWKPTAKPVEPDIRSYHLPALYSPIGMQPWYKCVSSFLKGFDPVSKKVVDVGAYQVFYNNILGESWQVLGSKIRFSSVSGHRRPEYALGSIPNELAKKVTGDPIRFLTCQVDVHKNNLAVTVMGWTKNSCCFVIDYWRFETETDDDDCSEISSSVWLRLDRLISEKRYVSDDGLSYGIFFTLVDAGYSNDTVCNFCEQYSGNVYPLLGADGSASKSGIRAFSEFKSQIGTLGYRIYSDYYKDRAAPVLRREWVAEQGFQNRFHFNAPIDVADKYLKELTVEIRRERFDAKGKRTHYWHRPGNARNELWDLLCYGYAAVDILMYTVCLKTFDLDVADAEQFWGVVADREEFFRGVSEDEK